MAETVDLQGQAIAIGTLLAIVLLAYGTFVGDSIAGLEPFTLAFWVLAATFGVVAAVHLLFGRSDLALANAGAAFGWVLVLLGDGGARVALGLLLLVLGGAYIVRIVLREREDGASA